MCVHVCVCACVCVCVCVLVAQSYLTFCNLMDCSPPGSFVHGILHPGKITGVGCHSLLQGIFPTHGSNSRLRHCGQILYCLSHQGSWTLVHFCIYIICHLLSPKVWFHFFIPEPWASSFFFFTSWRFFFFTFFFFNFTILYWFCHISTWIFLSRNLQMLFWNSSGQPKREISWKSERKIIHNHLRHYAPSSYPS